MDLSCIRLLLRHQLKKNTINNETTIKANNMEKYAAICSGATVEIDPWQRRFP